MKFLVSLIAILVTFGCSNKSTVETTEATAKKIAAKESTAQEESLPFPVYMTFDEFEHHIRQENDTTYVVNFWATWCQPCVAELPWFEQLIPAYANQPVKVLLVSMDFPKQIKSKLIPFVEKRKLEESVVALADMDYNEWIDKVSEEWDGAIPFTLIYNKNKQQIKLGELDDYNELTGLLNGVLN
ncbi:MAG: TlpA disulfide reductase family protein [Bacteroidota bacterium]